VGGLRGCAETSQKREKRDTGESQKHPPRKRDAVLGGRKKTFLNAGKRIWFGRGKTPGISVGEPFEQLLQPSSRTALEEGGNKIPREEKKRIRSFKGGKKSSQIFEKGVTDKKNI